MKEEIKEVSNQELLYIYRLLLEHQEYLLTEKDKLKEEDDDKDEK